MVNSCEFIFQLLESQSLTLTQSADPAMDLALMGPTWSHYDTFHLPGVKGNPGLLLKKISDLCLADFSFNRFWESNDGDPCPEVDT